MMAAVNHRYSHPRASSSEVKRIREALGQAMGREVSQLDLGVMLGLNLASLEVT
jgi:hypothetical protein